MILFELLDKVWSENNVHFIVYTRGKKLIFTQKIKRMILRTGGRVVMTDVDVKTGTQRESKMKVRLCCTLGTNREYIFSNEVNFISLSMERIE